MSVKTSVLIKALSSWEWCISDTWHDIYSIDDTCLYHAYITNARTTMKLIMREM